VALCSNPSDQYWPDVVSDGAGGAIVVWSDFRNGPGDIYGQRIDGAGALQWTTDGAPVCTNPGTQGFYYSNIAADGQGGVVVAWEDVNDIYAQRLSASGAQLWNPTGVAVCTAPNEQYRPYPISDGTGGVVVVWSDPRAPGDPDEGLIDIYAQRVKSDGTVDPEWPPNGLAVCTAPNDQANPILIPDDAGGAIAFWEDYRNGSSDLYAQRIDFSGVLGEPVVGAVPESSDGLGLSDVWPNPTSGDRLRVRFTLPGASTAWLEVLDVMGRRMVAREVGSLGAGEHTVGLSDDDPLAPGLYLVRLRSEHAVRTTRVVIRSPR
jgi:hypothetical protein